MEQLLLEWEFSTLALTISFSQGDEKHTRRPAGHNMGEWPVHCFKVYDIRGLSGEELSDDFSYRPGRAMAAISIVHHLRLVETSVNQALVTHLILSKA